MVGGVADDATGFLNRTSDSFGQAITFADSPSAYTHWTCSNAPVRLLYVIYRQLRRRRRHVRSRSCSSREEEVVWERIETNCLMGRMNGIRRERNHQFILRWAASPRLTSISPGEQAAASRCASHPELRCREHTNSCPLATNAHPACGRPSAMATLVVMPRGRREIVGRVGGWKGFGEGV